MESMMIYICTKTEGPTLTTMIFKFISSVCCIRRWSGYARYSVVVFLTNHLHYCYITLLCRSAISRGDILTTNRFPITDMLRAINFKIDGLKEMISAANIIRKGHVCHVNSPATAMAHPGQTDYKPYQNQLYQKQNALS